MFCSKSKSLLAFALWLILAVSCNNNSSSSDQPLPEEPLPTNPVIEYKNGILTYFGDEGDTGESCEFELRVYTDMELDDFGNPIGEGHLLSLDFNTELLDESEEDITIPSGVYRAAPNNHSFSPFTFNYGYEVRLDLPEGIITVPRGSFYGELGEGETEYEADLLREGFFSISQDENGVYTIEGQVIGDMFLKRNFKFVGELDVIDASTTPPAPNTNLNQDVTLSNLKQARLQDLGDIFFIQDNSYRAFELHLASEDCDLTQRWPTTGEYLQILLLVNWDADVNNGIPEGEYLTPESEFGNGGLYRDDIRPYIVRPGVPDKFSQPSGTWYMSYVENRLSRYGRLNGGRVVVEREGSAHRIQVELMDCSETPYRVEALFEQEEPIELFKF